MKQIVNRNERRNYFKFEIRKMFTYVERDLKKTWHFFFDFPCVKHEIIYLKIKKDIKERLHLLYLLFNRARILLLMVRILFQRQENHEIKFVCNASTKL